jgi:hypothetical protein
MADLKMYAEALLSSTPSVDMKTVATTNLYTVPTGKTAIVTKVIIRNPSASLAGGVCTFGKTTAKTDFLGSQTLTNISTVTTGVAILQPVPNATPVLGLAYVATAIFCIDVTTGITAASGTATIDVFGYLV